MAVFDCPWDDYCREFCGGKIANPGCTNLQRFAKREFRKNKNRCWILANVISEAAKAVAQSENPAENLMGLLEKVLIGEGMREGRGMGNCFAGNLRGSEGFRPELRDPFNQIQHAMAGVEIGYRYGRIGCALAKWQESEAQDIKLYDVTCPLGIGLNDKNYDRLAESVREAIGDKSCLEDETDEH